jgi:hypothetical protein
MIPTYCACRCRGQSAVVLRRWHSAVAGPGLIGLAQREAGVFGHVRNVCPKMVDGLLLLNKP